MYQCKLINCNECTTLVGDVDCRGGYACVGTGVYGKSLFFPLSFAKNLK